MQYSITTRHGHAFLFRHFCGRTQFRGPTVSAAWRHTKHVFSEEARYYWLWSGISLQFYCNRFYFRFCRVEIPSAVMGGLQKKKVRQRFRPKLSINKTCV